MNLHEYQAKALFTRYGVPVPRSVTLADADDHARVASELGGDAWMVKAQIHAGARGKGGGIKKARGPKALRSTVASLLGHRLVTPQTNAQGLPVETVLVEALTEIQAEYYLGVLVDRASRRVTLMASSAGGVDIEQVAEDTPEKILTAVVDPSAGLMAYQGRKLGFALGLDKALVSQFSQIVKALYGLFVEQDASLIEINPLVLTRAGELVALDAKVNLDDNALFRHPELAKLRDVGQEERREARARQHGLNYIKLDGNIGCMVNGAGLAMATLDLIKLHAGEPANFLDVGGNATSERVAEAFKLIVSDAAVTAVLVNIFGGIVRCDLIAEGIIQAVQEAALKVPLVVRLEGTNVEQGRRLLADSGFDIVTAEGLTEAADKVVRAAEAQA